IVLYTMSFCMELTPPLILIVSFIIGGLLGLERQFNERGVEGKKKVLTAIVGLRTFSLVAILGAIAGLLYSTHIFITGFIGLSFFTILMMYYRIDSKSTGSYGITTELSMLYSFL